MPAKSHSAKNQDLHGSAPDKSTVALLLIDVINDMDFPGNEPLCQAALPMAKAIAAMKRRAKAAKVPVIYVNDNFGKWQSDFHKLVEHCLHDDVPGKEIVRLLQPARDDYFVLKPKHSGFFSTTLDVLLDYLGVHTVVLAGLAGNICVLFTANDAYMRDFHLLVPRDCVVSNTVEENDYALQQMKDILKADIRPSKQVDFAKLRGAKRQHQETKKAA